MDLEPLFAELAEVFNGPLRIEQLARQALFAAKFARLPAGPSVPLHPTIAAVMSATNANRICAMISSLPFQWVPPETSSDPLYAQHSLKKAHVELLGPGGLVKSDQIRLGLYGMQPDAEYGIRTHAAEEVFIMLAGEVDWKRGDQPYQKSGPGDRSYHPSMLPHANRTRSQAFMSAYVWHGDIATSSYQYEGIPD